MTVKRCKWCREIITGKRKYCNDDCYRKYNNRRSSGPKKIICKRCGKVFESFQPSAKYCSLFCEKWAGYHKCEICGRKCKDDYPLCGYCKSKKKNLPVKIQTKVEYSAKKDMVWPRFSGIQGVKTTDACYVPFR